jgi:hypothetical protein
MKGSGSDSGEGHLVAQGRGHPPPAAADQDPRSGRSPRYRRRRPRCVVTAQASPWCRLIYSAYRGDRSRCRRSPRLATVLKSAGVGAADMDQQHSAHADLLSLINELQRPHVLGRIRLVYRIRVGERVPNLLRYIVGRIKLSKYVISHDGRGDVCRTSHSLDQIY